MGPPTSNCSTGTEYISTCGGSPTDTTPTGTSPGGGSPATSGTGGNGPLSKAKMLCSVDFLACDPASTSFTQDFETTQGNSQAWNVEDACGALTAGVGAFLDCGPGGLVATASGEGSSPAESGATSSGNGDDGAALANAVAQLLRAAADDAAETCGGGSEDCASAARYARDLLGKSEGRAHATYAGGYNSDTEQVFVGCSSNPVGCAEDDIARQGGNMFTKAFGWRGGQWEEIPVCRACQATYSPGQFPPDVSWESGGAWDLITLLMSKE